MFTCFLMWCVSPSQLLVARLKEAFSTAKLNRDDDLRNTLILTTGEIGRYTDSFFFYSTSCMSYSNCFNE